MAKVTRIIARGKTGFIGCYAPQDFRLHDDAYGLMTLDAVTSTGQHETAPNGRRVRIYAGQKQWMVYSDYSASPRL